MSRKFLTLSLALLIFLSLGVPGMAQAQAPDEQPVTAPTPDPNQSLDWMLEVDPDASGPDEAIDVSKIDPVIYVVDADNGRVVVMQGIGGKGYTSLGMPGYGVGRFLRPTQIWIDFQRRMYVADTGNNRVIRIDQKTEKGWSEIVGLAAPQGVAVDGYGVNISDTDNNQILVFDELVDGAKPREVIKHNRLEKPTSLWIDKDGALYICCGEDPPGGYIVKTWMDVDEPTLRRWKFYDGPRLSGSRFMPKAIITDESGIRMIDVAGQRMVDIRNIKGQRAIEHKFRADPRHRLRRPKGLAIDHRGFLFIVDSGNNRVLKLDSEGQVVDQYFVLDGDPATMLSNPTSIFIHSPAPPPPPPEEEGEDDDE